MSLPGAFNLSWLQALSVEELEALIRHHNKLYFELHQPEISDPDFDRLVRRLQELSPGSAVLQEVGSDIRKGVQVPKIEHSSPMLSLDKCYSLRELIDWMGKFQGDLVASPKIDGCAVMIRYEQGGGIGLAATRGDGKKGEDITLNVHYVKDIPRQIQASNLEVRGEIYMPLSVFQDFKGSFANPRNLAAGAIKQKEVKKTKNYQLRFFAYDLKGKPFEQESEKLECLRQLGFQVVPFQRLPRDPERLQTEWERYLELRASLDYEIDGVVFKADLLSEQARLGSSAHHPRFGIAYKFQGDSGITTLYEVEWSVARTGVITPIGKVEPVELSGAKVSRVSLHNCGMLQKLAVTLPSKVLMVRRGGVIPYLEKVLEREGNPIAIPGQCPSCGHPTAIQDDFLYCTNAKQCRKAKFGELIHFVQTVEIDGFGPKLIQRLYENGYVEDAADFYTLTQEDLLNLERMGEILASKLIDNIQKKRKLSLALFLQSLGIRELARHASQLLANQFGTLKRILQATQAELLSIHTFGAVMAREIVQGLFQKEGLIRKLLQFVELIEGESKPSGPLSGKSFLFTGKMERIERKEAEKKVRDLGGAIAPGVSHALDFLVIGAGGYRNQEKGNKILKAEKLISEGANVQILSEEQFMQLIS